MEGIVPFVPPAPVRPKVAEAVVVALADDASQISMATWILTGVVVAVMMASALGYWISTYTATAPRNQAAITGAIQDMTVVPPGATNADAAPAQPDSAPASTPASATVEPQPPQPPTAPRAESPPPMTRNPAKAAARQSEPSVFVPNPAWSSQVRRVGDVDPVTERSTMVILDAIQEVQERERQSRNAASKEVGRER